MVKRERVAFRIGMIKDRIEKKKKDKWLGKRQGGEDSGSRLA